MPLTTVAIDNAKPGDKTQKLADRDGLYLRIEPTGAKLWRFDYRAPVTRQRKTLTMGAYPAVSLKGAREALHEAKKALAADVDPGEIRKAAKQKAKQEAQGESLRLVAQRWFEANKDGWADSYSSRIWSRLEDDIFPRLGDTPIAQVDEIELLEVLRAIQKRGAIESAHRIKNYVRDIYRFARAERLVTRNPTLDLGHALKTPPKGKSRPALKERDLAEFMVRFRAYSGQRQTILATRLTLLTFVRTMEMRFAAKAEFEDLDGKAPLWRIPEERMKMGRPHLVPLSKQAVAIVRELIAATPGYDTLFVASTKSGSLSENTMLNVLYRMGYKGEASVHGFRRMASTILNEAIADDRRLFDPDWIEIQLAHDEEDQVRGAYNAAEYLPGRRKMMQWWADRLDRAEAEGNRQRLTVVG